MTEYSFAKIFLKNSTEFYRHECLKYKMQNLIGIFVRNVIISFKLQLSDKENFQYGIDENKNNN